MSSQKLSLKKKRTWETFQKDRLDKMSDSIISACTLAKKRFDEFLYAEYDRLDTDKFIIHIQSLPEEQREDELYPILQGFIDSLSEKFDLSHGSVKQAFSRLNKYLWYKKIKITDHDIKEELEWPEYIQEEKYAPSETQFISIITELNWKNRGFTLSLSGNGMRPVELMGSQKKHYTLIDGRYKIEIPYYLTKKRISRTVFASTEATPFITKLLSEITDEQFVWTKRRDIPQSFFKKYSHLKEEKAKIKAIKTFATYMLASIRISLNLVLDNLGLDMRYESTGEHKITLYSLRARFITRALKVLDGDVVHAIVGHGAYIQTYQRRTDEEKMELFIDVESEILIFDQSKNTKKIKRLTEVNKMLTLKDERLTKVEDMLTEIVEKNLLEPTPENKKLITQFMQNHKNNNF